MPCGDVTLTADAPQPKARRFQNYAGTLGEVRVYNRALAPGEVATLAGSTPMMFRRARVAWWIALLLTSWARGAEATAPVWRIMAVGDSITEGGATFSVYRPLLAEKLRAAGVAVEFVGTRGTAPPPPRRLWRQDHRVRRRDRAGPLRGDAR